MTIKPLLTFIGAITFAIVSTGAPALAKDGKTYVHLVVQNFETPNDADFPADFRAENAGIHFDLGCFMQETSMFRYGNIDFIQDFQPAITDVRRARDSIRSDWAASWSTTTGTPHDFFDHSTTSSPTRYSSRNSERSCRARTENRPAAVKSKASRYPRAA
jgi:hypothetical protein